MTDKLKRALTSMILGLLMLPALPQVYFMHNGFDTDSREIADFSFIRNGKEMLVTDGTAIKRFEVRSGKLLEDWTGGHADRILAIDVSDDGTLLVSGDKSGNLVIRDASDGTVRNEIALQQEIIISLDLSPDGSHLLVGSTNGNVLMIDPGSGSVRKTYTDHEGDVTTVRFSHDGSLFATAGEDRNILLYKTDGGGQIALLEGHSDWVRDLAFSRLGNQMFSCSDDIRVITWDISDLSDIRPVETEKIGYSWLTAIDMHPDGDTYATGNLFGTAWIITPFESQSTKLRYPVNRIAFVPGKQNFYQVMVATEGNGIRILDIRDMILK